MNTQRSYSGKTKIFITGIGGFIGSALAKRLVDQGYHVSGLVRKSFRPNPDLDALKGKVDLYEGDLRDRSSLDKILRDASPDYIYHFGALTSVSYSFDRPEEVSEVNYIGSVNLAESARANLPRLKGFLFSSSMEVYGKQDHDVFVETDEPHPRAPYAVAKYAFEKYLELLADVYKFPSVAVRQTNAIGRLQNDYFVLESFVTSMLKNPDVVNFGRKEPVRNFIHIEDLCDFWLAVLGKIETGDTKDVYGQVFNVGPDNAVTIEELARKIAAEIGWNGTINWNTREIRPGEVFRLNSSGAKAEKVFGWKAKITLDDAIKSGVAYWRSKLQK